MKYCNHECINLYFRIRDVYMFKNFSNSLGLQPNSREVTLNGIRNRLLDTSVFSSVFPKTWDTYICLKKKERIFFIDCSIRTV